MEEVLNAIVDSVNKQCERLMERLNDQVFEVKVYYFYDGEAVDLGACVAVCDINEENFREEYLSFTVHEEKLKLMILVYLEQFEKYDRYFQLKKLAREIPKVLKEKGKYITKTTIFKVEEYD